MNPDTTGNNDSHKRAAELMHNHGDELLAEAVEEVADHHVADEDKQGCGECGVHWPCEPWFSSNDRVLRWLVDRFQAGDQ